MGTATINPLFAALSDSTAIEMPLKFTNIPSGVAVTCRKWKKIYEIGSFFDSFVF
jgi:hypothetical protein